MLNPKVTLTNELVNHIQEERMGNNIGAATLSKKIGKPSGYISALENRRVKSIASPLLVKIFQVLYDNLSDDEIVDKIESVIKLSKPSDNQSSKNVAISIDDEDNEGHEENTPLKKIRKYNVKEDFENPDLIKGMIDEVGKRFNACYKGRPKDTVWILNMFLSSMRFDTGFTMAILSIPYFALEPLTDEERQNVLDDISEVFKKHLEIAKNKKENEKYSSNK